MKEYWGSRSIAPHIFISALDGRELSASRPGRFTPRERAPGTHRIGGWVGPRVGMDMGGTERKNLFPVPAEDRTSGVQPVAS